MRQASLVIRAVPSSYVALCGIWLLLTAFYVYLAVKNPQTNIWQGVIACAVPGIGFAGYGASDAVRYVPERNGEASAGFDRVASCTSFRRTVRPWR